MIFASSFLLIIHNVINLKIINIRQGLHIRMLHNRNKSSNLSDIQAGESLFDFLKRKKKFALETSLSKSRQKENIPYNSNTRDGRDGDTKYQLSVSPRKKYQDSYRETLRESAGGPSVSRNNQETYRTLAYANMNSTTPKRVTFAEDKEKEKKLTARSSFIQMISPMKKRTGSSKTPEHYATAKQASIARDSQKPRRPANSQQQFYRKNLNNSMSTLKQTLQKFLSLSSSIKQKSHSLFIELKPLLKLIEQSSNPNFAKRAEEAKLKLRTFEHLFKEFNIQNGNQIFQQFHRSFSEHLISLESNLRSGFEREKIQEYRRVREEKDNRIRELEAGKEKMEKEIDALSRKLEKLQKQADKLRHSSQTTMERGQQTYNTKLSQLENKIEQYELQINSLAKDLDASQQAQKALQKTVKDLKYLKEQAQKRFIEQNVRVKSTKQQFLLNQISILKKQFKNDMEQLTSLYSTKQKQQLLIIAQLRLQVSELQKQLSCQKVIESKITSDAVQSREQVERIRKQNQCLVTDLHRMNEELYQHWLALKDIKTLAVRLHLYAKFGKIYQDLAFNDQLFI